LLLKDDSQRDRLASRSNVEEHLRQERRDHKTACGRVPAYVIKHDFRQPRHFKFNIQESTLAVARQHVFERWQMRQLRAFRCRDRHSLRAGIMANEGLPIAAQADIEFQAVASVLKGEIKRRHRVFSNRAGRS